MFYGQYLEATIKEQIDFFGGAKRWQKQNTRDQNPM
jgi:hypothetical protein